MFEKKNEPLLSLQEFRSRVLRSLLLAAGMTIVWVVIGTIGFYFTSELNWLDAFYNAAMIASEMGPVVTMTTPLSKIFAAVYALISGLVFVVILGIAVAPIIHRFFHHFHLADDSAGEVQ